MTNRPEYYILRRGLMPCPRHLDRGYIVRNRLFAGAFVALLPVCALAAEPLAVTYDNAPLDGKPTTQIAGKLKLPDGSGPFAAVVLIHSCGGLEDNVTTDWPEYLTGQGYAAFTPNILGSRHIASACTGRAVPVEEIMRDVYGALQFLAKQPAIDASRIHTIGFSWGGWNVLEALRDQTQRQLTAQGGPTFAGGVAVYPYCNSIRNESKRGQVPTFSRPALIIGAEKDDWTPVADCKAVIEGQGQPARARMDVIAGAHHGFDQLTVDGRGVGMRRVYSRYTLDPDKAATEKARAMVKAFLEKPE